MTYEMKIKNKKSGKIYEKNNIIFQPKFLSTCQSFNPTSHGVLDYVAPMRGPQRSPLEIKEEVISDPVLLYSICYLVYLGVTCKKTAARS